MTKPEQQFDSDVTPMQERNSLENPTYRRLVGSFVLHALDLYRESISLPVENGEDVDKFSLMVDRFITNLESCKVVPIVTEGGSGISIQSRTDDSTITIKYAQYHAFHGKTRQSDRFERIWVDFLPPVMRRLQEVSALPSYVSRRQMDKDLIARTKAVFADRTEKKLRESLQVPEFNAVAKIIQAI